MRPRRKTIYDFSEQLNRELPKSEIWFQAFWKREGIEDNEDSYNKPFGGFIPDVINHKYRYVI